MKRKHLFILILLFVMLIPGHVNAGYVSSCASINDNDVLNNWGKRGSNGQYTRLAAKNVYYCETDDQSTNYNSHGKIYELMLNSPEAGKYRLYCLEQGKNAPITGTLVYQNKKYVGGPACAFYKYNGTGSVIRHNRIRYIQHNCNEGTCSTDTCTDAFLTDDPNCGGARKSSVVDNTGSSVTISKATFDNEEGDFYTYRFTLSKTGSADQYIPSLLTSISGARITTSATGGTSITSTRNNTIYVRIPKSAVSGSISVSLRVKTSYELSCTFKKFGLVVYSNGNSSDQKVAFRTVEDVTNNKTFTPGKTRTFTVTERGETTETTTSLMVNKYNMSGESLAGATFGLYSDNACTTSIDTGTTNEYGYTHFTVNKNTNYFVKELSAPEGYVKENSCRSVAVGEEAVDVDFYNTEKGTEIETGEINIKKIDQDGNPVAGASIALYAEPSCGDKAVLDETGKYYIETDSNGLGSFTVDTSRTYYVKEAITPYGFNGDTSCKVANAGDTITITNQKVTSELSYASIYVKKIDAATKEPLSGAEFSLYYDNACSVKIADATGKSTAVTDLSGLGKFDVATNLTYYIKETKAPDGYKITDESCKSATFGNTISFEDEKKATYQDVMLEKYDKATGDALPDAIFGLYSDSSCSTRVPDVENNSQAVTDSNGTATFSIDPTKTYYVKEIVPPEGYLISDATCKSVLPGEAVAFFDDKIINYQDIKVLKTDTDSGAKLSGAIFGLFSDSTCSTAIADKNGEDQLNTNSEGIGTFTVDSSKSYYIKELAAPEGYQITDTSCKAADIGGTTTFTDKKLVVEPTYTNINIKKVDADSNVALAGAAFGLYSDASCTVDAFDKSNNSSVTTDSTGMGKFTVDDSKTYYIKETAAPGGYNLSDSNCKTAIFNTIMEFRDTKVVVAPTYDDINVKKVDSATNAPLSGAVFSLYYDSTCSTSAVDKDGNSQVTTGSTGIGKFSVDNSKEYYVKETKAPTGYNITDTGCKKASFDTTITFSDIKQIEYENIRILKRDKDDTSRNLAGAIFGLYSDSSCSVSAVDYNGSSSVTTNGYGVASFKIEKGRTYYLKETKAPDGYELSSTCVKANTTTEMEFDNKLIPVIRLGKIVIKKTDIRNSNPIEGVVFRLYKSDKTTIATDHDGVAVPDLRTDSNGKIEIGNLEYGTYYLKEVSAPDAYIQEIELKEVRLESEVREISVENMPISVLFSKRDSVTDKVINGGKYRITTKDGDLVEEFSIEDGVYTLYITPGEYKFSEVEAPVNYVNASVTFDFKVDEYGTINITSPDSRYYYIYDGIGINIVNDKEEKVVDVPKTGTSSNILVIATAVILILGGAVSIIIMKKGQFSR